MTDTEKIILHNQACIMSALNLIIGSGDYPIVMSNTIRDIMNTNIDRITKIIFDSGNTDLQQ